MRKSHPPNENQGFGNGQAPIAEPVGEQQFEDLSHHLSTAARDEGFSLRHVPAQDGSGSVHFHGPKGQWLARVHYQGKGTDKPDWTFHVGDQVMKKPQAHTPIVNHLARALRQVFTPRGQFQNLIDEAQGNPPDFDRHLQGAADSLGKAEGKLPGAGKTASWQGRTILDAEHANELENSAALREFRDRVDRDKAEAEVHSEYQRNHHHEAAAHHLKGMKMAQVAGDEEEAHKHAVMYALHLGQLGHSPYAEPPGEVKAKMNKPDEKLKAYRYKGHAADSFLLGKSESVNTAYVLQKAWPKDDAENQENANAHMVVQDHLMENGHEVKPPSTTAAVRQRFRDEGHAGTIDAATYGGILPLDRTPTAKELDETGMDTGDYRSAAARETVVPERAMEFADDLGNWMDDGGTLGNAVGEPRLGAHKPLPGGKISGAPRHQRLVDTGLQSYGEGAEDAVRELDFWSTLRQELKKPTKMKKAWPKDEAENQANAKGFSGSAEHSVMEDGLIEQGAKVLPPGSEETLPVGPLRDKRGVASNKITRAKADRIGRAAEQIGTNTHFEDGQGPGEPAGNVPWQHRMNEVNSGFITEQPKEHQEPKFVGPAPDPRHDEKQMFDYSHLLPPESQQAGHKLTLRHTPERHDDYMEASVPGGSGWAYPGGEIHVSGAHGEALRAALQNHGAWVKASYPKRNDRNFWSRLGSWVGTTPVKKSDDGTGVVAAPKPPEVTNTKISPTVVRPQNQVTNLRPPGPGAAPGGLPKITPQEPKIGGLVPPPSRGPAQEVAPHPLDLGPGMAGHPRQISAPAIPPVTPNNFTNVFKFPKRDQAPVTNDPRRTQKSEMTIGRLLRKAKKEQ